MEHGSVYQQTIFVMNLDVSLYVTEMKEFGKIINFWNA
jgi:hypothetical protein